MQRSLRSTLMVAIAAAMAFSIAACSNSAEPPGKQSYNASTSQSATQTAQAQPVVVQAAAAQDNTIRDIAVGALIGHTVSSMVSPKTQLAQAPAAQHVTVNRTTIIQRAPPIAKPSPAIQYRQVSAPAKSYTASLRSRR